MLYLLIEIWSYRRLLFVCLFLCNFIFPHFINILKRRVSTNRKFMKFIFRYSTVRYRWSETFILSGFNGRWALWLQLVFLWDKLYGRWGQADATVSGKRRDSLLPWLALPIGPHYFLISITMRKSRDGWHWRCLSINPPLHPPTFADGPIKKWAAPVTEEDRS